MLAALHVVHLRTTESNRLTKCVFLDDWRSRSTQRKPGRAGNYPYLVARQHSSAIVFFQYTIANSIDEHIQTYWLTRNNIRNTCLISCFFQLWISQLAAISHLDLVKTAFWSFSESRITMRKKGALSPRKIIVLDSGRHLLSGSSPQKHQTPILVCKLQCHSLLSRRRLKHSYHHNYHSL